MPRKIIAGPKLAQAIDEFMEAIKSTPPPLAPETIRSKARTLRFLVRHASRGEQTPTHRLTDHTFQDTLTDITRGGSDGENHWRARNSKGSARAGRGPSAIKADRATLRQFTEFLHHKRWVDPSFNPLYEIAKAGREIGTEDVRRTKVMRRIPREEWPALLDAAEHPRDRLMVACGLWWARRVSDLAIMQWRHLDLSERDGFPNGSVELFNVKKGRRIGLEALPIWPELRVEVDRYLTWFRPIYGEVHSDWPLVPRKVNSATLSTFKRDWATWPLLPDVPVHPHNLTANTHRVLRAYLGKDADLYGEGGHTLRRSGGRWVAENWGIEVAQRLLDHMTTAQTRVYVGWSKEDAKLSSVMRGDPTPEPEAVSEPEPEVVEQPKPMAVVVDMFSRQRVA